MTTRKATKSKKKMKLVRIRLKKYQSIYFSMSQEVLYKIKRDLMINKEIIKVRF